MRETLETRIRKRGDVDVFLRAELADLGGYNQVGGALRGLVSQGKPLRIGFGLYLPGREVPGLASASCPEGLATLKEALERISIETYPSRAVQDYNAGRTTRLLTGRVVAVRQRIRRKIGYVGISLSFERAQPAAR